MSTSSSMTTMATLTEVTGFKDISKVESRGPDSGISNVTKDTETVSQDPIPYPIVGTAPARRKARIQFAALCYCLFLAGWSDATSGPLLPRIQEFYHIGYTVVSILFIMSAIGFVCGAAMNVWMTDKWGFGIVLILGSVAQVIGYLLDFPGPPFPVLCIGYLVNGWGIAVQDAQANAYVASLKEKASAKMSILHAVCGLGGVFAPLAATQFSHMPRWSFFYLVSLGIALVNTIILTVVFRGRSQDACLEAIGQPAAEVGTSSDSKYRQILRLKVIHLLALFSFLYVGMEITVGGWTITYIINQRRGGASSGYISSGLYGGLALGRVALLWVNEKVGERRVMFVYAFLTIGLEVTVWFVPSLLENAVAVSFIGVFLGPMYPIMMNQSALLVPPWLLTGSIGWIASFGQSGSAILPFIAGALASKFGIRSLPPFVIILMVIMITVWAIVPKGPRRVDRC